MNKYTKLFPLLLTIILLGCKKNQIETCSGKLSTALKINSISQTDTSVNLYIPKNFLVEKVNQKEFVGIRGADTNLLKEQNVLEMYSVKKIKITGSFDKHIFYLTKAALNSEDSLLNNVCMNQLNRNNFILVQEITTPHQTKLKQFHLYTYIGNSTVVFWTFSTDQLNKDISESGWELITQQKIHGSNMVKL